MTEQEAIDLLRFAFPKEITKPITEEVISMAVSALERQIPMKPRFYASNYYCNRCDDLVGCHDTIMKWANKYCKNCGQRIDWGNEE